MTIGDRIKERRTNLDMTPDELADELGKSRATIYRYENGDIKNLPTTILEPLAEALHTTPAYLMGWTDDPHNWEQIGNDEGIYPPKDYEGSYEDYVKYKVMQESDDLINDYYNVYDDAVNYLKSLNCNVVDIQGTNDVSVFTPKNEHFTVCMDDLVYNFKTFGNSHPGIKELINARKMQTKELGDLENKLLAKYNTLDEKGKHTVNTVLEMEYTRCVKPHLVVNAANAIDGASDGDKAHGDEIMKNF